MTRMKDKIILCENYFDNSKFSIPKIMKLKLKTKWIYNKKIKTRNSVIFIL